MPNRQKQTKSLITLATLYRLRVLLLRSASEHGSGHGEASVSSSRFRGLFFTYRVEVVCDVFFDVAISATSKRDK
jgi:hypothetical protein